MAELKPCPFCGGEAIVYRHESRRSYVASCKTCQIFMYWGSKKLAIEHWNKRSDKPKETE